MREARRVVQVEVPRSEVELVADALWQAGPSAVVEDDLDDERVRLTADVARVDDLPGRLAGATVVVLEVDGDAYLDAWRTWAAPVRAGRHVVLHPAWLPLPPTSRDGDVIIRLDPGRAFGSGSHPSTRLVVAALEAERPPAARVLDVGTGSGVLAVAACLLGAGSVVAIDIDVAAGPAVVANARRNGVAERITVATTPLDAVPGTFDLVLANIGAGVLRDLARSLRTHVAPGGLLVLSGLLDHQADEVVACYEGVTEVARMAEDGWVAVVLRAAG